MSIALPEPPTVVLHGLDWQQAQAVIDALGEYHPRHVYDGCRLELRRILHGVSWQDYTRFLAALGDRSVRHTYDGWTLEMMSPGKDHDWVSRLMGRFIEQMASALDVAIQSVGSMTVSHPNVEKSIQPDQSFYVSHEAVVWTKPKFDPLVDPPPDLIVEVDVTNSCLPRMATFAALQIPEVWRHDGGSLRFHRLNASEGYDEVATSGEFPWVESADVLSFIERQGTTRDNQLVHEFVELMKIRHRNWMQHRKS